MLVGAIAENWLVCVALDCLVKGETARGKVRLFFHLYLCSSRMVLGRNLIGQGRLADDLSRFVKGARLVSLLRVLTLEDKPLFGNSTVLSVNVCEKVHFEIAGRVVFGKAIVLSVSLMQVVQG